MDNSIIWFRQDLRISDNLALGFAAQNNNKILPIYILDENVDFKIGSASKWFLHQALKSLEKSLKEKYNLDLLFFKGDSVQIIKELLRKSKAKKISWNRVYEPKFIARDAKLKADLKEQNIEVRTFNSTLLFEVGSIKNGSGEFFKVFTPFANSCLKNSDKIVKIAQKPDKLEGFLHKINKNVNLDELNLLPESPNWAKDWQNIWQVSEENALKMIDDFIQNKISNYNESRNLPVVNGTSRLSPFIHYGLISVRQIHAKLGFLLFSGNIGVKQFFNQILWREFSYNLLYAFPELDVKNFKSKFDPFPWQNNEEDLKMWQKGKTGYPLVDAGMRELWQTGWMHNRVRMVVASFLIKNLLVDWRLGMRWFNDCLVDENLANNAASWQWVAGSGADSVPYFRIFNPVLQSERFDESGEYIRKWLPELKNLSAKEIHTPFELSEERLKKAGIKLGFDYPKPIIGLKYSRDLAMAIYRTI